MEKIETSDDFVRVSTISDTDREDTMSDSEFLIRMTLMFIGDLSDNDKVSD